MGSLFGIGKSDDVNGKVVSTKRGGGDEEELSESKKLLQQVKDAGVAGIISYIFWEWAFWGVSVPVCIFGYQAATGHWPDFSNQEDLQKLGAEAFAFVNVARFAVPLRIGLALSTTPWVQVCHPPTRAPRLVLQARAPAPFTSHRNRRVWRRRTSSTS